MQIQGGFYFIMLTKNTKLRFKMNMEYILSLIIFSLDSPKGQDYWLFSHISRVIFLIFES